MNNVRSITIKDPIAGTKLIKIIFSRDGNVQIEAINSAVPFDCLIVYANNERLTIPVRLRLGKNKETQRQG